MEAPTVLQLPSVVSLLGVLLALVLPHEALSQSRADQVFATVANEKMATRTAEHIRLTAELVFIRELLAGDRRDQGLLLLDDEELRESLLERSEAKLADAELAAVYLDKHPLREGSQARIEAAERAVERNAEAILRARTTWAEVQAAQRDAVAGALSGRGLTVDAPAQRAALDLALAEADVERIQQQAAVDRYRETVDQGDSNSIVRTLPDRSVFIARHLTRQLNNPRARPQASAEGGNHPSRADADEVEKNLEASRDAAVELAVAAEAARAEMLQVVADALSARLAR